MQHSLLWSRRGNSLLKLREAANTMSRFSESCLSNDTSGVSLRRGSASLTLASTSMASGVGAAFDMSADDCKLYRTASVLSHYTGSDSCICGVSQKPPDYVKEAHADSATMQVGWTQDLCRLLDKRCQRKMEVLSNKIISQDAHMCMSYLLLLDTQKQASYMGLGGCFRPVLCGYQKSEALIELVDLALQSTPGLMSKVPTCLLMTILTGLGGSSKRFPEAKRSRYVLLGDLFG